MRSRNLNSFGRPILFPPRNPKNATAIAIVNTLASLLAARYSPVVGLIRSWDWTPSDYPVIIDNMMNLEVSVHRNADRNTLLMLFKSAELTGNETLKYIAVSHAQKTLQNHIRADGMKNFLQIYPRTLICYERRWFMACHQL